MNPDNKIQIEIFKLKSDYQQKSLCFQERKCEPGSHNKILTNTRLSHYVNPVSIV